MEDYINIESDIQFQTLTQCEKYEYVNILSSANITDFSKLKEFENVERLFLIDNSISDLNPLQDLPRLRILNVSGTNIQDFSPLAYIETLEIIDASNTRISDLSSFSNKLSLQELFLNNCPISDLSSLNNIPELNWLELSKSLVKDLTPLTNIKKLSILNISNTPVEDISCLNTLTSLSQINIDGLVHLKEGSKFFTDGNTLRRPVEDYKEFVDLLLMDCPQKLREEIWAHIKDQYDLGFYGAFLKAIKDLHEYEKCVMLRVDWKATDEVLGQINMLLKTHNLTPYSQTHLIDKKPIDDQLKNFATWLMEKQYKYLDWDRGDDEFIGFIIRAEYAEKILDISAKLQLQLKDLSSPSSQNTDVL